jgi:hypothetical protein
VRDYPPPPRAHTLADSIQKPPPRDWLQSACSVEIVEPPAPDVCTPEQPANSAAATTIVPMRAFITSTSERPFFLPLPEVIARKPPKNGRESSRDRGMAHGYFKADYRSSPLLNP